MSSLPVGRNDQRDISNQVASGSRMTPSLHSSTHAGSSSTSTPSSLSGNQAIYGAHLGGNVGNVESYCDLSNEESMAATARFESSATGSDRHATPPPSSRVPDTPMRMKDSQQTFSQSQSFSTPLRPSTQIPTSSAVKQGAIKTLMKEEIGTRIFVVGDSWAPSLYTNLVTDEQITAFLMQPESGYSWFEAAPSGSGDDAATLRLRGRWSSLPEKAKRESQLYEPINTIFITIINDPLLSNNGTSRKVFDSHSLALMHDNAKHSTLPDTCIVAEGPSFQLPPPSLSKPSQRRKGVGYTNIAAVFDAKLESAKHRLSSHVFQMALYIR